MDIAIIGGGAAGMIAAIRAKEIMPHAEISILERMDRVGKKLLATGNGRCNYTNTSIDIKNYHGKATDFISHALKYFSNNDVIRFFRKLGVLERAEENGKIFPYSGHASAVLDALRFELERLSIKSICGFEVKSVTLCVDGFNISSADGRNLRTKAVIVATGGKASPSLGSNGSGFDILQSLGHTVTCLSPALVQLRCDSGDVRPLQGLKLLATAWACHSSKKLLSDNGEVLFTSYGLSGPPIFQLSSLVAMGKCNRISLDAMPEIDANELMSMLYSRRRELSHLSAENFFSGLFHRRIGNLICRRSGIEKLSIRVKDIDNLTLKNMVYNIKDLSFRISGLNGWENAQVTAGGVSTSEFSPYSMESKLFPGLFAAGEVLDIFGDCGGYNLQWAWSSGRLAGESAALFVRRH